MSHKEAIEHAIGLIREAGAPDHPSGGGERECEHCGYKGEFGMIGCACYDEWGAACTAQSPGPGCANGTPCCPVCGGDPGMMDAGGAAEALEHLEKALRVEE